MTDSPVAYGKYVLERPLARGGMGTIWVALDPQLKRRVALKTMHKDALLAPSALERFSREASTLAQLQTPHVVQIFDYGVAASVPYIVMELLAGEDLAARIERVQRIPLQAFAKIFEQTAKALTAAHAAGIIHRDLKPPNVFITQSGTEEVVKLVDFGIAAVDSAAMESLGPASAEAAKAPAFAALSHVGAVIGTPHYMSPEQARGFPIDHRSDLWSLGIVTYQALTGRLPFNAARLGDVIIAVCADPIEPPSSIVPELGPEVDRFFERALARSPAERFQSASEMAAAFHRLAEPDGPRAAKVLVVDDEPDMPMLVKQRFRRKISDGSYSFVFAADGLEALEQLRLHPDIDVVVSDIRMPNMDGLTMLAKVGEASPLTKVILVSAFGDMTNIREAMNRGAFDFLVKPVDYKDLQATIDKTVAYVRDARRTLRSAHENEILRMFANHLLVSHLPPPGRGAALPEGGEVDGTVVFVRVAPSDVTPAEALAIANMGMELIVPEVFVRGGMIGRFADDGVLALFQGDDHLERAAGCAVSARGEVERHLRRELYEVATPERVAVSAGIASGSVTLGAVGARTLRRMEYILFGKPVDEAIALAKFATRGQALLEEALAERLGSQFETRSLPTTAVPGIGAPRALVDVVRHRVAPSQDGPASTQTTAILGDQSAIVQTALRNGTTDH